MEMYCRWSEVYCSRTRRQLIGCEDWGKPAARVVAAEGWMGNRGNNFLVSGLRLGVVRMGVV